MIPSKTVSEQKFNSKAMIHFTAISYGFTWLIWLPGVLSSCGIIQEIPWPPFFAIGACGPMVAAIIVLHREGGWPRVRSWLRQGFQKKFGWQWWLCILAAPLLLPPLALWIFTLTGGEITNLLFLQKPWIVFSAFLLMVTIGGGQEEYGWRGFLLPRLLDRFRPWQADLILIPVHALWHLPLFINTYTIQSQYPFWLFLAFGFGFTLLINRVYQRTGGSILAAILFHGLVNTGLEIFPLVGTWVNDSPLPLLMAGILFGAAAAMITKVTNPVDEKEPSK